MFIDTHVHFNIMVDKKENDSLLPHHFPVIAQLIEQSQRAGVTSFINVGTSVAESLNSIAIATQFSPVFASVGIHPCDVNEQWRQEIKEIEKMCKNKEKNKIVAIGEIGLDFYHKPYNQQLQTDAFKAHIELALRNELPVIVHIREAADEALRVLEEYAPDLKGVNHCFSQPLYVAQTLIKWGFYLGIDAPITYPKNEWFRDVVSKIPLEHIILETDSPFLPPQQFRGKQNKPEYIPLFAQTIADLHSVSLDELGAITSKNAQALFSI